MNNEYGLKEVEFNGNILMAMKDERDGKIYVGVSWVCEGIGLTEKQRDRQVANMQKDIVLASGVKKLPLKYEGQVRNSLTIELDYLPLWLAKISITPKMQAEFPETVKNLVEYQLKAKEVLAKAFIKEESYITPTSYKEAIQQLLVSIEENEVLKVENEEMKPKADFHDKVANTENHTSISNAGKNLGVGEKKFFKFLRAVGVLYVRDGFSIPKQDLQNKGYFTVRLGAVDTGFMTKTTYTTKVTGEGKIYLQKLVDKYGGASVLNSLKMNEIDGYVKGYNQKKLG